MKYVPYPHQDLIKDHIIKHPRCNVWSGMGTGKTSSVLSALIALNTWPVLIIAPYRVAAATWPDEVRKFEDFRHLRIVPILGTVSERMQAMRTPADIYTVNYENLPWLIEQWGKAWPYKVIIADESTKLKGFRLRQGTKRARALAPVAFISERYTNLTGTPAPNGLVDLWGQNWFVDKGVRLGHSFTAFTDRWFRPHYSGYGIMPMPHAQGEIEKRMKDLTISISSDHITTEKPIENPIYVDLPPEARKLYKTMEDEMWMRIKEDEKDHQVLAFNAAGRTMKCLQLANGAAYVGEDAERWVEVHDAKIKALESVIEEAAGMPVLVAYHFRSDLDRLRKAFPRGRHLDKSPQTILDWNRGEIPVLFAHPASAGHGINLQDGGNIIAFFGHNWNLEEYQQIIERIGPVRQKQSGHNRPVFLHHIIARNTVDELVVERMKSKRAVQDLLLEAMRKKC